VTDCVYSPDGAWVFSVSADKSLKIWRSDNFKEVASIPLAGNLKCVAAHPYQPTVVCGDIGGNLYFVRVEGFQYRAIVVSAKNYKKDIIIRCPSCQKEHSVCNEHLGIEMSCPTLGCGLPLKINPFTINMD